jgi:hypothetical protein
MIDERFVYFAIVLNFVGVFSYLVDTVRGKIQPNKISWFLWGFSPLIIFFAQTQQHVGLPALLALGVGLPPLLIFAASFVNPKAEWKLRTFDYICGGIALVGLLLWYVTGIGNIAIVFSLLSDVFASAPSLVKSFTHPQSENYIEYLLAFFSSVITVLTIHTWNFATYGFSIYLAGINILFFVFIKFRLGKRLKTV